MKIVEVNIPKGYANSNDGLEDIEMYKLTDLVLLAGENGSGKTRVLQKIQKIIANKYTAAQIDKYKRELSHSENRIKKLEESLQLQQKNGPTDLQLEAQIKEANEEREIISSQINWPYIVTDQLANRYRIIDFFPLSLDLKSASDIPKNQLKHAADNITNHGIASLSYSTLAKVQFLQDRWFSATHQNSNLRDFEKGHAIREYEDLNSVIKIFLGSSLDRSGDGEATIYGFPIHEANLSNGQKIILQFCVAIYSLAPTLKDLILFLDEPENHLHPKVIIEVIDRIRQVVTNGQIWISTHSIPLLAHYDPTYIWFVEKGKISWAGNSPEKVLESLVGDESERGKLQDFIGLPAQYAMNRYAYESLFEPKVLMTGSTDQQSIQIKGELAHLMKEGKLKILDYGAGKGRLLANIMENVATDDKTFREAFDYIAFDKYNNDKEQCCSVISQYFGSSEKRYYNDVNKLLSDHDVRSFDVIVLCNVLHEIDPAHWLKLFEEGGELSNLLQPEGFLLLVEDQQIPTGEKAYQKGFIVLDTPHLKELFQITASDTKFHYDDKNGDGRLKAHRIPKACLERITSETRKAALRSLNKTAQQRIEEIRDLERNYKNGKAHGFWVQQYANTQLALSELG